MGEVEGDLINQCAARNVQKKYEPSFTCRYIFCSKYIHRQKGNHTLAYLNKVLLLTSLQTIQNHEDGTFRIL